VNHANLLASKAGTVALIDCDSFDITDGQRWFSCPVGVPTYTPPELKGKSFTGVRRTQQHDAFGLAVLLFHVLFLGRHPFSGIFRQGNDNISIEDAIREFRFAYSPDRRVTEMGATRVGSRANHLSRRSRDAVHAGFRKRWGERKTADGA
jgi:DNA-binding helix-hairpin-helix protein with protein kinase domain